jgi:preprotein translocase subunit SecY
MSELYRRIAFTLGALLVYRLAVHIPLPGLDLSMWDDIVHGAGLRRLAILALDITPYVTAAILVQVAMILSRRLRAVRDQGERGRRIIRQWTRYLTIALAAFQGYGIALGIQAITGLVAETAWWFVPSTVATLTVGTLYLSWLADQITVRGIGNGIALILSAGILAELPAGIASTLDFGRKGALSTGLILGLVVLLIVATAFVAWIESARRNLPVEFREQSVGARVIGSQTVWLSVKINPAGIMPAIFASWVIALTLGVLSLAPDSTSWLGRLATSLSVGKPAYFVLQAALIIFCAFFYTAFLLDPDEIAAQLASHGAGIPGVAPGEPTAAHIDQAVSRSATMGAVYLALICLLPEILVAYARVPFYFGGASLLIVVCTALDLHAQICAHMRRAHRG